MGRGAPRGAQGDGRRSMLRRLPRGGFAVAGLRGGQGTNQVRRPVRVPVAPEVRQDRTEDRGRVGGRREGSTGRFRFIANVEPRSLRVPLRVVQRPLRVRVRSIARRRPLGVVLHRRRERASRLLPPRRPRARARRRRRSFAARVRPLRRHRRRRAAPRDGRRGERVLDAGGVLRGRGAVGFHRRGVALPRGVRGFGPSGGGGDARAGQTPSSSGGEAQPPLRGMAHQVRRVRAPGGVRAASAGRHRARGERRAAPGGARVSQGARRRDLNSRRGVRRGAAGRRG